MGTAGDHGIGGNHRQGVRRDRRRPWRSIRPGTIIYTAGYTKIKQKDLDGSWVEVTA